MSPKHPLMPYHCEQMFYIQTYTQNTQFLYSLLIHLTMVCWWYLYVCTPFEKHAPVSLSRNRGQIKQEQTWNRIAWFLQQYKAKVSQKWPQLRWSYNYLPFSKQVNRTENKNKGIEKYKTIVSLDYLLTGRRVITQKPEKTNES